MCLSMAQSPKVSSQAVLTWPNMPSTGSPKADIDAMTAMEIPVAIKAYSIDVVAELSAKNALMVAKVFIAIMVPK